MRNLKKQSNSKKYAFPNPAKQPGKGKA